MSDRDHGGGRPLTRRRLLMGGAAAGIGAAAAIGGSALAGSGARPAPAPEACADPTAIGAGVEPFHGARQAGIETTPQAHAVFVALDLLAETDRAALGRMMRVLTDDAARLTQGRPALADSEPELATVPARLTVTFGFGPGLVERAAGPGAVPAWLRPLPAFGVDRLEDRWCGGDLLVHVAADDPLTLAHTVRMLLKDSRTFAEVRWSQPGFRRARGAEPEGATMRNLFGQVDGTVNPQPGTDDFDQVVWTHDGPDWLRGGTSLVLRRIHMDLDGWDRLDRAGREQSVGRTLDTGAPLTGAREHDEPDFKATTPLGFPVIAAFAHLRRARSDDTAQRIFRRAYNYDADPAGTGGVSSSGLLFASYQADVDAQYVPLQRRLDELDLLNEWTTPIGSAVFAIPPGCAPGEYVGQTLLGA
ncbi:Dyp-type peroxidase [Xylanimonas ulmi]|uniref:Dye decolorizing peroxidase n=1 Tax=Xylanimonas ulmi TaxID=228973 RepID=A0A4Q7LZ59_9MICO|nr:Dyp-type peroxidase [Xylanibacterium ulmi]RZS60224.1 dye decolorizing peroxidase [Xylanibacterium ulmi]